MTFDLGGRILDVTGSPGHHQAAITIYDRWTGFLLTGDTVLPGRLYAFDFPQFLASLDRMVALAEQPCRHARAGLPHRDDQAARPRLPARGHYQPDERPLEMTVAQLKEVRAAARSVPESRESTASTTSSSTTSPASATS